MTAHFNREVVPYEELAVHSDSGISYRAPDSCMGCGFLAMGKVELYLGVDRSASDDKLVPSKEFSRSVSLELGRRGMDAANGRCKFMAIEPNCWRAK